MFASGTLPYFKARAEAPGETLFTELRRHVPGSASNVRCAKSPWHSWWGTRFDLNIFEPWKPPESDFYARRGNANF